MCLNKICSLNLQKKIKHCTQGSSKDVFICNDLVIKIPKHSYNLTEIKLQKDNSRYLQHLIGINQILTEIDVWHKEQELGILCPIQSINIENNIPIISCNKIIPANIFLNTENFELEYFCKKIHYPQIKTKDLFEKILYLVEKYHLDYEDLTENENNFGYDVENDEILILDYGYKSNMNYNNTNELIKNNISLLKKYNNKEL